MEPGNDLVRCTPDPRLLDNPDLLPPDVLGEPPAVPPRPHSTLVAAGVALTGATLLAGLALVGLGIVLLASSSNGAVAVGALAAGALLVATHWGWAHVAVLLADRREEGRLRSIEARRSEWLARIEPYGRVSVRTEPLDDGSIAIVTERHEPVRASSSTFTFERRPLTREIHLPQEPTSEVAERAELLRRGAAEQTRRERESYEGSRAALRAELGAATDEERELAALRETSRALSERINSHLRDPPAIE